MGKLTSLTALSSLSADDLVAVVADPTGAHTSQSAVLNRIAAVTAGLTPATAADLNDDDLAMIIQDPTGAANARKITLAELGQIAQNATLQLYPTDRWFYEVLPQGGPAINTSFSQSGTVQLAGGTLGTNGADQYGAYIGFAGPSTLTYLRIGSDDGNEFRFLYCGNTKFYASWKVRPLRNNNTWIWLCFLDEYPVGVAAWNPATGLLGVPVLGFCFADDGGTNISDDGWMTIVGDAATNVRSPTGVPLNTSVPQFLEVESNEDFTELEFRIDGVVVDRRTEGFPTSGLSPILLAQANGAGNGGFDFYYHKAWRVPHNGTWPKCEP